MGDTAVGADLVEVARIERALRRWPGLLERMFTEDEQDVCLASRSAEERLAARFAAKEAAFKALGRGWPEIDYRDVEVRTAHDGAPSLLLSGRAAALAGTRDAAVSMAHAGGIAMAQVVLS
jgi:holo-[acyl-carrier protein] synthase